MLDAIPQNCTCPPSDRQLGIYFVPITMGLYRLYEVALIFSNKITEVLEVGIF